MDTEIKAPRSAEILELFVFCTRDRSEYKYYALLASFMVGSSALLVSAFRVLSVSFYPNPLQFEM